MTVTPTTDLQDILSARKAELTAPHPADIIDVDPGTGEIMPASAANGSPPEGQEGQPPASLVPVAAPAPSPEQLIPFPPIPPKVIGGLPYAPQYAKLARTICNTEMVPGAMRGRWDAVTAAFMRGYEMGLGPMQALDSFNVIDGKVGLTAEAMRALVIQAGHQILLEDLYDGTTFAGVKADCHRSDWPDDQWRTFMFTMDDARTAGLLAPSRSGKPTSWQKYPRAMCDARATSGAGRRYFPDVLAGMSYTPEELRDFDGPAEQEEPPSPGPATTAAPPTETAQQLEQQPSGPEQQQPSTASASPSPASAPEGSSAPAPESPSPAESTAGASATSSEAPAGSAPPTPSTPPRKASGSRKKAAAAPTPTPAPSSAAPPAPAPAASTPPAAQAPADPPPAGEAGVLVQMAGALTEVIKGLPTVQQPLCRAFIQQHYPGRKTTDLDADELQKAIDIAAGWPDSADQHPLPEQPGEVAWQGFDARVEYVDGKFVGKCKLCPWELPEAATSAGLPEFRRLEHAKDAATQHEQGAYDDGTPFCPGRPAEATMNV